MRLRQPQRLGGGRRRRARREVVPLPALDDRLQGRSGLAELMLRGSLAAQRARLRVGEPRLLALELTLSPCGLRLDVRSVEPLRSLSLLRAGGLDGLVELLELTGQRAARDPQLKGLPLASPPYAGVGQRQARIPRSVVGDRLHRRNLGVQGVDPAPEVGATVTYLVALAHRGRDPLRELLVLILELLPLPPRRVLFVSQPGEVPLELLDEPPHLQGLLVSPARLLRVATHGPLEQARLVDERRDPLTDLGQLPRGDDLLVAGAPGALVERCQPSAAVRLQETLHVVREGEEVLLVARELFLALRSDVSLPRQVESLLLCGVRVPGPTPGRERDHPVVVDAPGVEGAERDRHRMAHTLREVGVTRDAIELLPGEHDDARVARGIGSDQLVALVRRHVLGHVPQPVVRGDSERLRSTQDRLDVARGRCKAGAFDRVERPIILRAVHGEAQERSVCAGGSRP